MFYKYFFANDKPVIVTEGKTDIRYLKAALMSLHTKYPQLIEKDKKGQFIYKFSFFRRSKRWKYFFDVSLDGADAMKILYRYHVGNKRIPSYLNFFCQLSGKEPQQPTILIYDNEQKSDRPLKKFLNEELHATPEQKAKLESNYQLLLVPNSKLFLVVPPVPSGKEECEIEDLFSADLLAIDLDGKTFCRKDKFDTSKYFGKEIFSQFVYDNYRNIDFSKFIPMLDSISSIVEQSKKED